MSNHQFTRPEGTGGKSILGSDDKTPLNQLEKEALGDLDQDKLNELAKCLFTLNNRRYGPIPGAYMVMCTNPGKEWCVAQLDADRAKPFIIFEDKIALSIKSFPYISKSTSRAYHLIAQSTFHCNLQFPSKILDSSF